jgi:hypothetical protein
MDTLGGPDGPEAQECRGDFWLTLREAVTQCGGDPALVERYADRPLREAVDLLAQNGIRMVYIPSAHIASQRQASNKNT